MKTFQEFILECYELVEGYEPLPSGNKYTGMLGAISRKSRQAKLYAHKRRVTGDEGRFGTLLKKNASQIKKLKSVMRNHDPLESRFKELENQDRGEKKSKTKLEKDYELSSDGKYRKRSRVKEEVDIYDIEEGKVEWDNPKRPLQSGLTPREKNRAKRISTGVEDPNRIPSERDLERYGKLKIAHDDEKGKKVSRGKRHEFGLFKVGPYTSVAPKGELKRHEFKKITNWEGNKLETEGQQARAFKDHKNIKNLKEPKESFEYELEESSTGEKTRGRATLARGRGADMTSKERSIASIAKKAGLRGTGKYSTKDLRTPSRLYTNNNPDGYGDKGSTKVSHYVTTHASPRSASTSPDLEIINKKEYVGIDKEGKIKFKHHSSTDSVRKAKDFKKAITRSGGDKRGKVHDVSILPDDAFREKNQSKGRMPLGRNLVKGVKDIPKHLKAAGAKKGKIVVGKPNAVLPDEDKKTGAEKRGKLYNKILGSRSSKRSEKTGVMVGSIKEVRETIQELEESSGGERTRGRATLARGRGADMDKQERTTASVAKKAGLKGTGKYSTKDLRKPARDYTTYDSEDDLDDIGSTEQDHFIRTYSSARRAAKGERLITKMKPSGKRTPSGMTKLKSAPSSESVRKVKDLRKQMTKSGASKTGRVHTVDIMHRDSNVGKGDRNQQMERGRNFIQAVKDTPKHLKKAGAKKGDTVVGKPTAVMPGEDKKTGEAKRAKLYGKIFGKKSTKASPKTGLMTGRT